MKSAGVGVVQGVNNALGVRGGLADKGLRAGEWISRQAGLPEPWDPGCAPLRGRCQAVQRRRHLARASAAAGTDHRAIP